MKQLYICLFWLAACAAAALGPAPACAQQKQRIEISGRITDSDHEPLAGVSVLIRGTTIGVATGADGRYVLETTQRPNMVVEISFLGMKSQSFPVRLKNGKATIDAVLESDTDIEEVVVTGMFDRPKEGFTGSVITIKGDEIKQISTTNIAKALSTIDPGFRVMENLEVGSDPNRLPDMHMRGTSTLPGTGSATGDGLVALQGEYDTYPNQPLLLLDGFEISVQTMADLDPDRVASITILKDASATAIYGSKAANGVIVIETLTPRPGTLNVTYNGNVRIETPDLTSYNLMNAAEKIYLEKIVGIYPENDLDAQRDYQARLREVKRGVNTYWLSKPLRTSVQQRHALTLEGGSNELRYKLYAGLNETPGVMKESRRSTQTASLDLSYRFKKFLLKNSVTADNAVGENSPYGSFSQYTRLNPYLRPYDEDGNISKIMQTFTSVGSATYSIPNPLYNTTFHSLDRNTSFSIRELFKLEYRPTSDWILQANVSVSKGIGKTEVFRPAYHTAFNNVTDPMLKGDFSRLQSEELNYAIDLTAMWNKNIRNTHYISANLRYSVQQTSSEAYGAKVTGFPNDRMDHILFGKKYDENMSGSENTSRSIGGVLTLGYSYKYRYSIDANLRIDGSSQFGRDNRFAPFWSAGFRWNAKNEEFLKKADWLADLVVATSYGVTGTQGFAPYQSRQVYSYANLMRYYLSSDATGAELVALGNDHLKWQQTDTWNSRLEFSLLRGRLTGRLEYYIKKTKNALTQITLAPSLGFSSFPENMGMLENRGVEFTLSFIPYRNDAKQAYWIVSVNGSHNKNKLAKISDALRHQNQQVENDVNNGLATGAPEPRYMEGKSITGIWAVRSLGIDPATGDEILLNRDGSITSVYDAREAVICGDTEPTWQGNINSTFNYKGFGATVSLTYRFGGQIYNTTLVDKVENADPHYNVDRRMLTLRWQNPGDVAQYKRIVNSANGSQTNQTSRFIMDDNTLQMGALSLSYRMDRQNTPFLRKLKISSMKWAFNMEDIFYISTVKRERGLSYPFSRQFALSLNIVF